jgi:hypothetical protein
VTLEAKKALHVDNGRFAETVFMADIARRGQMISFCEVNAHFQNGKAEQRIRLLQDLARSQLLHAMHGWLAGGYNYQSLAICNYKCV